MAGVLTFEPGDRVVYRGYFQATYSHRGLAENGDWEGEHRVQNGEYGVVSPVIPSEYATVVIEASAVRFSEGLVWVSHKNLMPRIPDLSDREAVEVWLA